MVRVSKFFFFSTKSVVRKTKNPEYRVRNACDVIIRGWDIILLKKPKQEADILFKKMHIFSNIR